MLTRIKTVKPTTISRGYNMIVFYNPSDSNQVMAIYTHGTSSSVWTDLGYLGMTVSEEARISELNLYSRDCRLVLDGNRLRGIEARTNPNQPSADEEPEIPDTLSIGGDT